MTPQIQAFFDPATATVTYVVHEPAPGGACAIIDSVLDYDPKSGRTSTASADRVAAYVREHGLRTEWLLETHAHADNLEPQFQLDGSQFGRLFADGETFSIGALTASAMHVPGHTPADMAYRIGDAVFVGDTLFMPDVGTARCDFPGGDAHQLFRSIRQLLSLPDDTRLYMCHDYPPAGRDAAWQTTVAEQRRANIHVRDGITEDDFVAMRTRRDATLSMPTLILPAIQVNIRAGHFPPPEDNGVRYLKIPVDAL